MPPLMDEPALKEADEPEDSEELVPELATPEVAEAEKEGDVMTSGSGRTSGARRWRSI